MRRLAIPLLGFLFALPAGAYPPTLPSRLLLTVRETAGVARVNEVVRSGVPIPRSLNLTGVSGLAIVDGAGTPVPAEFEVLARWDAGLSTVAPIQWLLVSFPANVPANGAETYRVVTDGSSGANPSPANPLTLTQSGGQVTVATGAATFRLGANGNALFDEVRLADGTLLAGGGTLSARAAATDVTHTSIRGITVEHAGPLVAIVVVEGAYGLSAIGGGGLGSRRRYVFRWGSPTAIVRHSVAWEGDLCGMGNLACGGSPNGLLVESVKDGLSLPSAGWRIVTAIGSASAPAVRAIVPGGSPAWVRQSLRAARTSPLAFDVNVPGTAGAAGTKADGGILCASAATGAVAIALDHMHRFEPQALRLLSDGSLSINVADDKVWLGARQGLYATFAVSALPASPVTADLMRLTWAPLDHPLHAWAEPAWFAASDAVLEFPVGTLPPDYLAYDSALSTMLSLTRQKEDEIGLPGLMTFGLFPRTWANPIYSDEVDCGGGDPTPAETWDDLYWCATWTDYHNTAATAPASAMRSGDVSVLDEIAGPAALRQLHTQVFQCAPGDTFFYCGQAPSGYGGYRLDNNGSHAYLDNLVLHYWLTGDRTVVQTLQRGATTMRNYHCSRRPAAACLATDPPADIWAGLTGRVASQWNAVYRFLGLASDDASFLDDYHANVGRAFTQQWVQAQRGGVDYGFLLDGTTPVTGGGTFATGQLWMVSQYDMNVLDRLRRDTADAPIGSPAIPPSQILAAWARTLTHWGSTVAPGGDGTVNGVWPNGMLFTFTGSRVGGSLTSVAADPGGSDPYLYETGKSVLSGVVVRAGELTADAAIQAMGRELTRFGVAATAGSPIPLSKVAAEYVVQLHPAVARMTVPDPPAVATRLYVVAPCRVVDTRTVPAAPLLAGTLRNITVTGSCGIPSAARSVAANVTVDQPTGSGDLKIFPAGTAFPDATAISFRAGLTRANNAILPLGGSGQVSVRNEMPAGSTGSVHFILDVVGWFE